ncbi:FHA domain-containing protein [Citricoccus muralis]|uniref:FHA domain-containing protein n=2 Tax=Citricoccus muralis TaxID=169134 RepID=A0A3D9L7X6_9MICC|nr:FHA domain-containing protein [Citricoccus muralis]
MTMSQTAKVRYSAGPWLGLVRGRCLVALPADASEETAAVAWDLLAGTPGVERLLATVLSGRLDLTGLPSFAIVSFREGTTLHAILRGDVALRMNCTDGSHTELIGTGVATWNERVVQGVESFELLVDDAVADVENLPLESGAVRLASLHADLVEPSEPETGGAEEPVEDESAHADEVESTAVDDAETSEVEDGEPTDADRDVDEADDVDDADEGDEAVEADEAGPEHVTEPDLEPDINATIAPGPRSEPSDAESEQAVAATGETTQGQPSTESADDEDADENGDENDGVSGVGEQNHEVAGTDADDADDADDAEEAGRDADEVDDRTIAGPPASPSAVEASSDQRSRPSSAVPGPQELIDSVPWLAAARKTVPTQPPEPVASEMVEVPADLGMTVAPEQSPDDHPHHHSGDQPEPGSDATDGPRTNAQDADDADTVMSPSAPGLASRPKPVPAPIPAPPAQPAGPASDPAGTAAMDKDHDGETVMKSDLDLQDLPPNAPAPAPAPPPATGPVVLARQCSQGHANPPTSAICGICGQSLSGEAQQLRRPSLGRLRMSTGEVVELDRPAVIGRQPQAHRVGSGTMPRMLQVRSPNGDISRSHCEVVLEGWHVQLRDLKATNGTVLIREGQAPRRLGQGESLMVLDGDIADLGDGVSLRFEGLL